jgi:hypothetical protein
MFSLYHISTWSAIQKRQDGTHTDRRINYFTAYTHLFTCLLYPTEPRFTSIKKMLSETSSVAQLNLRSLFSSYVYTKWNRKLTFPNNCTFHLRHWSRHKNSPWNIFSCSYLKPVHVDLPGCDRTAWSTLSHTPAVWIAFLSHSIWSVGWLFHKWRYSHTHRGILFYTLSYLNPYHFQRKLTVTRHAI